LTIAVTAYNEREGVWALENITIVIGMAFFVFGVCATCYGVITVAEDVSRAIKRRKDKPPARKIKPAPTPNFVRARKDAEEKVQRHYLEVEVPLGAGGFFYGDRIVSITISGEKTDRPSYYNYIESKNKADTRLFTLKPIRDMPGWTRNKPTAQQVEDMRDLGAGGYLLGKRILTGKVEWKLDSSLYTYTFEDGTSRVMGSNINKDAGFTRYDPNAPIQKIAPVPEPATMTPIAHNRCHHCGSAWAADSRANCSSCGATD
jgi:hypothetical protein